MVQESDVSQIDPVSSTKSTTVSNNGSNDADDRNYNPHDGDTKSYPSDTVAAVTIAILAVVIIITMLIVFRALRKRQRARRGQRFGESVVPTITTGVMGSGGAAFSHSVQHSVPVRGLVRWESVNPSSGGATAADTTHSHDNR